MSCHSSSSSSSFPSFRFFSFSPVLVGSSTCRSAGGYTVHVRSVSCSAFPSRVTRNKNYSSNRDPISPIIPPPFSPSYFFARRLRYLFLYSVFLYFHNVHAPYFNDRALSSPPLSGYRRKMRNFKDEGFLRLVSKISFLSSWFIAIFLGVLDRATHPSCPRVLVSRRVFLANQIFPISSRSSRNRRDRRSVINEKD